MWRDEQDIILTEKTRCSRVCSRDNMLSQVRKGWNTSVCVCLRLFVASKRTIEKINQKLTDVVIYKMSKGGNTEDVPNYIFQALKKCKCFM